MSGPDAVRVAGRALPTIRTEMLRAQLRPVIALALAVATLIGAIISIQYAWLRFERSNPLDEIDAQELRHVLHAATPEQWPVLARWIAVHGLGIEVEVAAAADARSSHGKLPDGRRVALSDVLCVVVDGQRVDPWDGRALGVAPAAWRVAIGDLADGAALRLKPDRAGGETGLEAWSALLVRLDSRRVAVLASPDFALPTAYLGRMLLLAFAVSATAVAGFVAVFLFALRRRFADRSAARLSAPVERLAAAVRLAAAEADASRRVTVEAPAEVAQLATDFNELQARLARTLDERTRLIAGQRDLVASLSHELRTPLTVLRGHAELLSREPASAARAVVMLRQIEDLHRLLSDLLDMARLESIEATLSPEDVALSGLVDEMIERFGAAAWRQGVLLRPVPPEDRTLAARADARWLRQILANLLSNAIRHTPEGGLVTLGARRHGARVELVVEDTGIGLGAARARHDLESRAAGIGLRVVRRLAAAMDGAFDLEATGEGGTRAVLRLPAAVERAAPV